jgi:hypothetical protein
MSGYSITKTGRSKLVFILSIVVSLFWFPGQVVNVYHFALTGAIFEFLWFPIVATTFILPIVSFIFLVKEKFSLRSFYLYSILIVVTTILVLVFLK